MTSLARSIFHGVPPRFTRSLVLPIFACLFTTQVPAQSADPAPVLQQAREAARQDRNRDSALLFERAISLAPDRRAEFLPEYADQLTYSGSAREAVAFYQEALKGAQGEPRLRLLRGLGLALLWSDQPVRASGIYEEYLRARPDDTDATRNLARSLLWSERKRTAAELLQAHLREHPNDQEARVLLAQSLAWRGLPHAASEVLDHAGLAGNAGALALRNELRPSLRARTQADAHRSTQSDRLEIETLRFGHEVPVASARGAAGLRLSRMGYESVATGEAVRVARASAHGRWRFSEAAEINAELGRENISPEGSASFGKLVYAGWITWWAGDALRLDLSSSRQTFDNLRSLRLGLTLVQNGVSVDLTPDERQRYNVRLERGLYSDGNRRSSAHASGEWRWSLRPPLWLGVRHSRSSFAARLDNGYFNPDRVDVTQATLRFSHRFASAWDLEAFVAAGREHAVPDGSKPAYDASLALGYRVSPATRLEARAQRFTSRTQVSGGVGGFERTTFGLRLDQGW